MRQKKNNEPTNIYETIDENIQLDDLDNPDETTEKELPQAPEKNRFSYRKLLNPHIFFLLLFVVIVLFVVFRFSNWGKVIDLEEFFKHNEVEIQEDTLDTILPLLDSEGQIVLTKKKPTILFFGNSPFADYRDDSTGVVNLIQQKTQGTVYNFAITNSYMASHTMNSYIPEHPMDSFCPYWLILYMALKDSLPYDLHDLPGLLGNALPPEFPGILDQMDNIDMNTVDVIAFMYDGYDYLLGNAPYNYDNPTDVTTFGGNLEGAIEVIQNNFPHIRIIVMSPTYAYALNPDGTYASSYLTQYHDNDTLADFVAMEGGSATNRGVTFVDNFYGGINEDEASDYLEDHLHLNENGRQLVADRFLYALERYSEK